MTRDPWLLDRIVCPATRTALRYEPSGHDSTAGELVSDAARLAYPVQDGVPILLIDRARRLDLESPGS